MVRRGGTHDAVHADHGGFNRFAGREGNDQRHHRADRKVDVTNSLVRFEQHMMLFECCRPKVRGERLRV